jgi:hypothetical protein
MRSILWINTFGITSIIERVPLKAAVLLSLSYKLGVPMLKTGSILPAVFALSGHFEWPQAGCIRKIAGNRK